MLGNNLTRCPDACAVMCRRLLECLLLLAFERAAKGEVIRDASGEYRAFADIIGLASSNRHIKLARGAGAVMGKIEYVGDLAAHHPTYTTRQKDIDEQRLGFQRVVTELIDLAEIKSKGTAGLSADVSASLSPWGVLNGPDPGPLVLSVFDPRRARCPALLRKH